MSGSFFKFVSCYLVLAMVLLGAVPRVFAGLSPSEAINLSRDLRINDLEKIQKVLEMRMVKERLEKLGFTQEEIQMRLDQLDDKQLHELALNLDELRVAGNGTGVIIAVVLIGIFLVLLLLYLNKKILVTDK
jgi:hypothetical protein